MSKHKYLVLGIHPSSRGFGWVLFENSLSAFDWGTVDIRGDKNARTLIRIGALLDKYQPGALAIEAFDEETSRRAPRIRRLYRALISRAEKRDVAVHRYTRANIRAAFAGSRANTREEIAAAVAQHVEALRPRLPKLRKIWNGEHPNIALFNAAACALTHYIAMGGLAEPL